MKKIKLICDINVFYKIANFGKIPLLDDYDLYITHISVIELITSKMVKTDFQLFKKVIESIKKYAKVIYYDPIEYLSSKITGNIFTSKNENTINNIIQHTENSKDYEDFIIGKNIPTNERETEARNWTIYFKNELQKAKFINLEEQDIHLRIMSWVVINLTELFQKDVRDITEKYISENFACIILCSAYYIFRLINGEKTKVDQNDNIDFFNLIYVSGEYKYLSLDKQLIKAFNIFPLYTIPEAQIISNKYKNLQKKTY